MKIRGATAAIAVVTCALVGASVAPAVKAESKKKSKSYAPPYKNGPTGGDEFNYVHQDRETGQIGIFRIFPGIPPVVGCAPEPSAAWGMLRATHRVKEPVKKVSATFDGVLDPYVWATVGARNEQGDWLGVKKFQGPHAGTKTISAKLFDKAEHGEITIEFGLQMGDACPQVGAGVAEFTKVSVN